MSPRPVRPTVPNSSPLRDPLTPQVGSVFGTPESQTPAVPESQTPAAPKSGTPAAPESRSPAAPTGTQAASAAGPKWRDLERKEARLRADQLDALAALRRQLSGKRRDRSEIITDNTLIRVAVDLLLSHAHRLHGDGEEALLHSVLPRRRNAPAERSGSPGVPESETPGVRE